MTDLIEKVIDQVAGSMAIEGFILAEEDKERIRRVAADPSCTDAIMQDLILKHTSTEQLDRQLQELLSAELTDLVAEQVRKILKELRSREPEPTPAELQAMWPTYMRLTYPEPILDPATGTMLQPSCHGKECLGNGTWLGYECCCDECDYYLDCFPPFAPMTNDQ